MSGSKKVTVGYKYYLGAHMILCHGPVDAVTKINVDNKTAWSGSAKGGAISINAPDLFGGKSREGGVEGIVDIEMGREDQGRNGYLVSRLGEAVPAFRGVCGLVLRQVYIGLNPYLKKWSVRAQRVLTRSNGSEQWYAAKALVGQDMNPAHIIRECLTDTTWGMGYPEADIDEPAFRSAADQLHAEKFGLSLLWDRAAPLDEFISTVLSHIDATLYVSRTTGRFSLTLARSGYDATALLLLDESSVTKVENFKRKTTAELTNQITVMYWNASTGKENSITVQDIALIQQQGGTVGTTVQYPGITTAELATRVAARDLKTLSSPLANCTLYANRAASFLNVGDVFRFSWPRLGVKEMVMRVANIELGTLDSNLVRIDCVEDVFALGSAIYAIPPIGEWVNPNQPPVACPYHIAIEAPYYELAQRLGDDATAKLPATTGFAVVTGVRPGQGAINARLFSYTGSAYEESGAVDFCPTALLSLPVKATATELPLTQALDLDQVRLGSYVCLEDEIVRVDAINTVSASIKVGRGCLDTVPVAHPAGTRLFFADDFLEGDHIEYAQGETVRMKLLPTTGLGQLDMTNAPEQRVKINARAGRPYPPGNLRINNVAYPERLLEQEKLLVSWVHRNRLQQTANIIDTLFGNIGPEAGTTYSYRLRRADNNAVLASQTGVAGTSVTILVSYAGEVILELWSVREGWESFQKATHRFWLNVEPEPEPEPEPLVFVGSTPAQSVKAARQDIVVPAAALKGDLMLACVMHRTAVTPPSGWALLKKTGPFLTSGYSIEQFTSVFYKVVNGEAGKAESWLFGGGGDWAAINLLVFRSGEAIQVTQSDSSLYSMRKGPTYTTPALTPTTGGVAVACFSAVLTSTGFKVSSGWNQTAPDSSTENSSQNRMGVAWQEVVSGQSVSATFTANSDFGGTGGVILLLEKG